MEVYKTRIRKETKANGDVIWTPEYKAGICWYSFYDWKNSPSIIWDSVREYTTAHEDTIRTEEFAKGVIDLYIRKVNHKNACMNENKIVSSEVKDYP